MERLQRHVEGVEPSHIFNYDETNAQDDPGAEEAFFGGGCKYFEQAQNSSKVGFSVMFCCSADGKMLMPYVVYKSPTGALYESWCQGGPEGAAYGANKSGWFDVHRFNAWFKHCFLPHIRNDWVYHYCNGYRYHTGNLNFCCLKSPSKRSFL